MNEKKADLTERIQVEIFNKAYVLRSAGGAERVADAARIVDERMRQISAQLTTHDVVKIAVLAALNLADEMRDLKSYYEEELRTMFSQTPEPRAKPDEEAAPDKKEEEGPQSWFDDFFDSEVPVKDRSERLSSRISAKLQSLRVANQEEIRLEAEDE